MSFLIEDLLWFGAASFVALPLLLLPGFGLVRLLAARPLRIDLGGDPCWALALGPAILAAIDALVIRWLGISIAILLHLALAIAGWRAAWDAIGAAPRWLWALAGVWWVLVAWTYADTGDPGALHQSLTVLDLVKHAAVVAAIADHGLPLIDPFVARDTAAGYYHYFYLGPALIDWLTGSGHDARPAFMAAVWANGASFLAMAMLVARRAGLVGANPHRFAAILIALCFLSGLDLLPVALLWQQFGVLLAQPDWWADEVRWASSSLLWVPHHLAALAAAIVAALLIVDPPGERRWPAALLAGVALASCFGMSAWIAVAMAMALAPWWLVAAARRSPAAIALPIAGAVALLMALPQFHDLAGRASDGFPLAFGLRQPITAVEVGPIAAILLMPLSLGVEFGLFALGSWGWWRSRARPDTPMARFLPVMAVVGLIAATCLRSTVINNDFGWRAAWLVELPALLWTAAWIARGVPVQLRAAVLLLGALGLGTSLYDAIGVRFIRPPQFVTTFPYINAHPAIDAEQRLAWRWIDAHLPQGAVVQPNPATGQRVFDFGLYGRRRVAVADAEAQLFGSGRALVRQRIATIAPVFTAPLPLAEVRARTAAIGADTLLLTAADPIWQQSGGPPADWRCAWRSAHVCVARMAEEAR